MKRIKNKKGMVWVLAGQRFEIDQIFDIPDTDLVSIWTKRTDVLQALSNSEFTMFIGEVEITDPVNGIKFLLDIQEVDEGGAPIYSPKTNSTGWTYKQVGIDFVTSCPDSLVLTDYNGVIKHILTMRCYDYAGVLLETQEERDLYCVKTVIDALPDTDVEMLAGTFKTLTPFVEGRLWFIIAPDYPAPLGCKVLAENISLRFDKIYKCDGRNRKKLKYNGGIGTNKMRGILTHAAGEKFDCQFLLEEFVP